MPVETTSASQPPFLEENLLALESVNPAAARMIRRAAPPDSSVPVRGRDGVATYSWTEPGGLLRWLGRSSMPSVSAPALIDAFQPGEAGILLYSMGHGGEIALLLGRIEPFQAIMVVEPAAWKAGLALRLHDFSEALRLRRLLVFAGDTAWDALGEFLLENPGFLEPQRVLAWPWFEPETISDISAQVSAINQKVNQRRAEFRSSRKSAQRADGVASADTTALRLAIVAPTPTTRVRRLSHVLCAAASSMEGHALRLVRDDPSCAHPWSIEDALARFRPSLTLYIDAGNDAPPRCPISVAGLTTHGPVCVLSRSGTVAEEGSALLSAGAWLAVPGEKASAAALAAGAASERMLVVPPAALPIPRAACRSTDGRLAFYADGACASAQAAGLHLATHLRIWSVAEEIIRETVDTCRPDSSLEIVQKAEARLKIRLESVEVRAGIAERLRMRLVPRIVCESYLVALVEAGLRFDLYGQGWRDHPRFATHYRGEWPPPEQLGETLPDYSALVYIGPGEPDAADDFTSPLLDALAAGLVSFVRGTPQPTRANEADAAVEPALHAEQFNSRRELISRVRSYLSAPEAHRARAKALAERIQCQHTWHHRLRAIMASCR